MPSANKKNDLDKLDYYCPNCRRTLKGTNFYNSPTSPNGKLSLCKRCATMHVDCWDPQTYLWILQECDVPYIPDEWNKTILKEQTKDPNVEITGLLIVGKYLSKMHINQFRKYHWKDTEALRAQKDSEIRDTMERQGYSEVDIQKVLQTGVINIPDKPLEVPAPNPNDIDLDELTKYRTAPERGGGAAPTAMVNGKPVGGAPQGTNFMQAPRPKEFAAIFGDGAPVPAIPETEDPLVAQLTDEDKLRLRLKWGKDYSPAEWIELEKFYNEMMASYDIQTASHFKTLELLCKTALKCNQLIDINDVEGYQKMSRVYDSLMKQGNFTAAQSKEVTEGVVDSVGELVALCERDAFIPRYYVEKPADKVDQVIFDLQQYTKNLITDELGMGNLLENALKKLYEEHDLLNKTASEGETTSEEDLLMKYDGDFNMVDEDDYVDFQEMEDSWAAADQAIQESGGPSD